MLCTPPYPAHIHTLQARQQNCSERASSVLLPLHTRRQDLTSPHSRNLQYECHFHIRKLTFGLLHSPKTHTSLKTAVSARGKPHVHPGSPAEDFQIKPHLEAGDRANLCHMYPAGLQENLRVWILSWEVGIVTCELFKRCWATTNMTHLL